jgi:uncharacterized protein
MKVIIDTNVLISAVLKGRKPRQVMQAIADHPNIDWIVSQEIVAEYKDVLSRPKLKLPDDIKSEWLEKIETIPILVDVDLNVDFPRDQKDAKFLACAIACHADFLITGDRDFDEVQPMGKTLIISVSLFIELFLKSSGLSAE